MSQFEFGYFVNSPELSGVEQISNAPPTNPANFALTVSGSEVSDCAPLLVTAMGTQLGSRKSSDGEFQSIGSS